MKECARRKNGRAVPVDVCMWKCLTSPTPGETTKKALEMVPDAANAWMASCGEIGKMTVPDAAPMERIKRPAE